MLEIADREFNSLASEVDAYAEDVAAATKKGELDVEINSTSLSEFLKSKLAHSPITIEHRPILPQAIAELRDYGVTSLAGLDKLITDRYLSAVAKHQPSTTDVGFLRKAMMFDDLDRYFSKAWKEHFTGLAPSSEALLLERYGENETRKVLNRYLKARTRKRKFPVTKRRRRRPADSGKG
jgi:hypothetical protein